MQQQRRTTQAALRQTEPTQPLPLPLPPQNQRSARDNVAPRLTCLRCLSSCDCIHEAIHRRARSRHQTFRSISRHDRQRFTQAAEHEWSRSRRMRTHCCLVSASCCCRLSTQVDVAHELGDGVTWSSGMLCSPPFIYIGADPALVEHVLKTAFWKYEKGTWFRDTMRVFLGDGIFNVDGKEWQKQRKGQNDTHPAFGWQNRASWHSVAHPPMLLRADVALQLLLTCSRLAI